MSQNNNSIDDSKLNFMYDYAKEIIQNSYSPYSNCKVSSSVLGESGNIYCGVNIENSSYRITLCAEHVALSHAISSGERRIKSLLVLTDLETPWSPCAVCRQAISEFADETTPIYLANFKGIQSTISLKDLLPKIIISKKTNVYRSNNEK